MTVIDDYLKDLDTDNKEVLLSICTLVRDVVPDAVEAISYGVPSFRYKNKMLIGFAENSSFMSIYPTPPAIEYVGDELNEFKHSKGAIQFTAAHPLPLSTLRKIIMFQKHQIEQ